LIEFNGLENKSYSFSQVKAIRQSTDGFLHFTFSSKKQKLKPERLKIIIKIYFCIPYSIINRKQSK